MTQERFTSLDKEIERLAEDGRVGVRIPKRRTRVEARARGKAHAFRGRHPASLSESLMATTKVRRVRVGTRLSLELRNRLTKYCAASGISERTISERWQTEGSR